MRTWYSIIIFLGGLAPKASGDALAKLVASDAAEGDYFGGSVAVSGDLVVVGVSGDDHAGAYSGSAYVFRMTNASWTQVAKLAASDAGSRDKFGHSVAVSGDLVVVGAYANSDAGSASGSAYVFRTTNGGASWTETAKLVASDGAKWEYFGRSVAISGDLVVVGAVADDDDDSNPGSAYVFRTTDDGASWTQTAKLVASDAAANDRFGYSVAISGDLVVVGAYANDDGGSDSGAAYVFRTMDDGASWTQTAKLLASDAAAGDRFGDPVAIRGDLVVVGAFGDDDAGDLSGSAYAWRTTDDGASWTQTAKLVASDAAAEDYFGRSVAISGGLVVVGAYGNDDAGSRSGSAYVFPADGSAVTPRPTRRPTPRPTAMPNPQPAPVPNPRPTPRPTLRPTTSSGGGDSSTSGGGGVDTIVVAAAAVAAVVAVAIACLCIKRRRTKAAAARADFNVEAP